MTVIIDKREGQSMVPEQLEKLKVPIEYAVLDVGDYIVNGRENVVFERKEAGDFVSSLVDGRLNNELYQMSYNFPKSIILVEGYISEALMHRQIHRSAYISALAGTILKHSVEGKQGVISMVQVDSPFDTALYLKWTDDKLNNEDGQIRVPLPTIQKAVTQKENDRQIIALLPLPRVGKLKAIKLLRSLDSAKNVWNASEEQLVGAVGPSLGKGIFKFTHESYDKNKEETK